jgi:hypothetical protein
VSRVKLLSRVLRTLNGHDQLPLEIIPELVLFTLGQKHLLRFVLDKRACQDLSKIAEEHSLFYERQTVKVRRGQNTFSFLEAIEQGDPRSDCEMIVIGDNAGVVHELTQVELYGSARRAGELLGYPRCCLDSFEGLCAAEWLWAQWLVAQSDAAPYPALANRLTIGWGGMSPVGEFYPCSLDCPSAIEIGRSVYVGLGALGLVRLQRVLAEHSCAPIYICEDGAVQRCAADFPGAITFKL